MKQITLAIAFLMALTTSVFSQDFNKGLAAAQTGDFATALQEWRPLAEQGDASAQFNLALMYSNGMGVLQDDAEAAKWYLRAAEQGNASAQNNLGLMYRKGNGVLQDDAEAVKWFRMAAEQGDAQAQTNLGFMYHYGKGVLKDNTMAHMWYNIGSANGNDLGAENREIVAKEMTSEDISKATALARECMSSNYQKCGY